MIIDPETDPLPKDTGPTDGAPEPSSSEDKGAGHASNPQEEESPQG